MHHGEPVTIINKHALIWWPRTGCIFPCHRRQFILRAMSPCAHPMMAPRRTARVHPPPRAKMPCISNRSHRVPAVPVDCIKAPPVSSSIIPGPLQNSAPDLDSVGPTTACAGPVHAPTDNELPETLPTHCPGPVHVPTPIDNEPPEVLVVLKPLSPACASPVHSPARHEQVVSPVEVPRARMHPPVVAPLAVSGRRRTFARRPNRKPGCSSLRRVLYSMLVKKRKRSGTPKAIKAFADAYAVESMCDLYLEFCPTLSEGYPSTQSPEYSGSDTE